MAYNYSAPTFNPNFNVYDYNQRQYNQVSPNVYYPVMPSHSPYVNYFSSPHRYQNQQFPPYQHFNNRGYVTANKELEFLQNYKNYQQESNFMTFNELGELQHMQKQRLQLLPLNINTDVNLGNKKFSRPSRNQWDSYYLNNNGDGLIMDYNGYPTKSDVNSVLREKFVVGNDGDNGRRLHTQAQGHGSTLADMKSKMQLQQQQILLQRQQQMHQEPINIFQKENENQSRQQKSTKILSYKNQNINNRNAQYITNVQNVSDIIKGDYNIGVDKEMIRSDNDYNFPTTADRATNTPASFLEAINNEDNDDNVIIQYNKTKIKEKKLAIRGRKHRTSNLKLPFIVPTAKIKENIISNDFSSSKSKIDTKENIHCYCRQILSKFVIKETSNEYIIKQEEMSFTGLGKNFEKTMCFIMKEMHSIEAKQNYLSLKLSPRQKQEIAIIITDRINLLKVNGRQWGSICRMVLTALNDHIRNYFLNTRHNNKIITRSWLWLVEANNSFI